MSFPDTETSLDQGTLFKLIAIEEIRQLKARYFRMLDTKDWEGFAAVFTPDAVLDSGAWTITGAGIIADRVSASLEGITTVHHGHTPEITIDSPTTAHAIWAMADELHAGGKPEKGLTGSGHYHEEYTRTGDGWRISRSKLTRLHISPLPGGFHVAIPGDN